MDRLSRDYILGYSRAILDAINAYPSIAEGLKWHKKRINDKLVSQLLQCWLDNREKLREDTTGFIRYNGEKGKFEYFCEEMRQEYLKQKT